MHKILEGDVARFEVPDLLALLNSGRRTGVLVLEREDQESKLFFRDGSPVVATTTKEGLRFGSMLLRLGKVTTDALERALERKRAAGHRIGQVLLAERLLNEDELASFLKVQVSEIIFETFEWQEGVFTFYDGVPPPTAAVTLEMDLQNLVMEGLRRIDGRGRLAQAFPDLDMAVESLTNPERVKLNVNLTPEEWQVYFLVDGRRTLTEICRLVGNPDERGTLQILRNLVAARFVTVVPPREEAPSAPAVPAVVAPRGTTLRPGEPSAFGPAVSVQFAPGLPSPKPPDDTKDVVTPKAVQYMEKARRLTVSRLVLVQDGSDTSFPLTRDTYTLGRHRNNDIVISDPKVSSFHARIDRTPDGFMLVDLKSRNGSFVNGNRIEAALLKTGDEVRLGTARLVYKVDYTSSV